MIFQLVCILSLGFLLFGCSGESSDVSSDGSSCTLSANTSPTSTENSFGCVLVTRDSTSCLSARTAQGLSGFWLKFSCRVTLTKSGTNVTMSSDSRPDHVSVYFNSTDACYEEFIDSIRRPNPNNISLKTVSVTVPITPSGSSLPMGGGAVGLAVNGVSLFSNAAAPEDDIYNEIATFDKCEGHPQLSGQYHYHSEPPSISNSDSKFIGVMRDGYPIYGRKDINGTSPSNLDASGGHTAVTEDSSGISVYHYHANLQSDGTDSAYFLTTGTYKATIGSCTGCK